MRRGTTRFDAISGGTGSTASRGLFRADRAGCRVAFLSALRYLQNRAKAEGADAIIAPALRRVTCDGDPISARHDLRRWDGC